LKAGGLNLLDSNALIMDLDREEENNADLEDRLHDSVNEQRTSKMNDFK
jgi:hypothetical protein